MGLKLSHETIALAEQIRRGNFDAHRAFRGHTGSARAVAFRPDGQILTSGGSDGQEGMNITGATEMSEAQKVALKALGAVETGTD